jgi:outer membrane protein assembly factor BamB
MILFGSLCTLISKVDAQDWLQFRGPSGDGRVADGIELPLTWDSVFSGPVWSTIIPGHGWSSPIVVGNRIWLTSSEQIAMSDTKIQERLSKYPFDQDEFQAHASVQLFAIELDADSGEILRRVDLFAIDSPPPIHATNSYASPTSASDGTHVYCHFGSLGTACIDAKNGNVLWKRSVKVDELTGGGGSPVLWKNLLCFSCDGTDEQFVIAMDKYSGSTKWKTPRPQLDNEEGSRKRAFSTPVVVQYDGRDQLISAGAHWLVSYDPATGQEWWRAKIGSGHAVVPKPVFDNGIVYACTGYPRPELVAVKVDGMGDVTNSHIVWRNGRQIPEISSPALVGNELYVVSGMGIVSCIDARKGETVWIHRVGNNFASSPILTKDRIYFTSKEGVTTVIAPGLEYKELAKNELFGQTQASASVYKQQILIRTESTLYSLGANNSH